MAEWSGQGWELWNQGVFSFQIDTSIGTERLEIAALGSLSAFDIEFINHRLGLFGELQSEDRLPISKARISGRSGYIEAAIEKAKRFEAIRAGLSVAELVNLAGTIGAVLSELHAKKIAHKNLSPDVIYKSESGFKLGGFAVSALPNELLWAIKSQTSLGDWKSPEENNDGVATPASDLYSLGLVLFFMATGKVLRLHGRLDAEARRSISQSLQNEFLSALVIALLHPNPERRLTAQQLVQRLDAPALGISEQANTRTSITFDFTSLVEKVKEVWPGPKVLLALIAVTLFAGAVLVGNTVLQGTISEAGDSSASPASESRNAATDSASSNATNLSDSGSATHVSSSSKFNSSFEMPDMVGMTKPEAVALLKKLGVQRWIERTGPSQIAKGLIASTVPPAGTEVRLSDWHTGENYIELIRSTGSDEKASSETLKAIEPRISWEGSMSPNSGESWGFYEPTVANGELTVGVDAKFAKETTILLGNYCQYLVDEILSLGCYASLPKEIVVKPGNWSAPIWFKMNIGAGGINTPATFQIKLKLRDEDGTRSQKLSFTVESWK